MFRLLFGFFLLGLVVLPVTAEENSDYFRAGFAMNTSALTVDGYRTSDVGSLGFGVGIYGAYEFGNGWGIELGLNSVEATNWVATLLLSDSELVIDEYSAIHVAPTYTWSKDIWFIRAKAGVANWDVNMRIQDAGFGANDSGEDLSQDGVDLFYSAEIGLLINWFELSMAYSGIQSDPVSWRGAAIQLGFRF